MPYPAKKRHWPYKTQRRSANERPLAARDERLGAFVLELLCLGAIGDTHQVVAADFFHTCRRGARRRATFTTRSNRRRCNPTRLSLLSPECLLGHGGTELGESVGERLLHLSEEPVCFLAVLNEWIALSVRAKIDARARVLHELEVLDPECVGDLENEPPSERAPAVAPELCCACGGHLGNRRIGGGHLRENRIHLVVGAEE